MLFIGVITALGLSVSPSRVVQPAYLQWAQGGACARRPPRLAACVTMLENPLARIFGGGEKKDKGGPLSTGLDAITRDAPLPVKLAVGLMKPLVGALEAAIVEGQEDADALLIEAQSALRLDNRATAMLGADIQTGAVFSSASSNLNGQKSIQLQCQCAGSSGSGIVSIRGESGSGGGSEMSIVQLQLQSGGSVIDVPTLRGGGGRGASGGGSSSAGDVIDVEVS